MTVLVAVLLAATTSTAAPSAENAMTIPELIISTAQRHGVDPRLAVEVAIQESGLNQAAQGSSGEIGIFQLMPATAASLGVDPNDLQQNIEGGMRYLSQQLARFGGDIAKALAAYNWGPERVARAAAAGGDWLARAPASTQNYVRKILSRLGIEWQRRPTVNVKAIEAGASKFRALNKQQQTTLLLLALGFGIVYLSGVLADD